LTATGAPQPTPRGLDWIAFDARASFGALLGAAVGAGLYAALLPTHEDVWLVGLALGVGTATFARDRSVIRGLVLGAVAAWASALAQCVWLPLGEADSFLGELASFHTTLDAERLAAHAAGCLAGGWLAARSFFARARRVAGV
jgi:hypothetical protein